MKSKGSSFIPNTVIRCGGQVEYFELSFSNLFFVKDVFCIPGISYYSPIEVWLYLFFNSQKKVNLLWVTDCSYPQLKGRVV